MSGVSDKTVGEGAARATLGRDSIELDFSETEALPGPIGGGELALKGVSASALEFTSEDAPPEAERGPRRPGTGYSDLVLSAGACGPCRRSRPG